MDVTENISAESIKKSDQNSTDMESKSTIHNLSSTLCPMTPYSNKESVKFISPLTANKDKNSLFTPAEDVFDPFDCQPDKHMLGPNDNLQSSGSCVARKLDFSSKECVPENGALMETVYESILEAIISKQAEDILTEILAHDVLMTPPSVARLADVAETCPDAPLKPKPVRKSTNVNAGLCRKLEF